MTNDLRSEAKDAPKTATRIGDIARSRCVAAVFENHFFVDQFFAEVVAARRNDLDALHGL